MRTPEQQRNDLFAIWNAALNGVRVEHLLRKTVSLQNGTLVVAGESYLLKNFDRIVVLGGGKASGAMAQTLENILEPLFDSKEIFGWVNVPEDCVKPLRKIHLHPARPAGVNEPTEAGVAGTSEIIRLAKELTPDDLCICLISGGGSALLPAPVSGITLQDKQEITRLLSESGADIQELNTVRKQISTVKGGGLKRLCAGKKLITLILSDVLGDPLDVIASGPTVDNRTTAPEALNILYKYREIRAGHETKCNTSLNRVMQYLQNKVNETAFPCLPPSCKTGFVRNIIIGNNAAAVESAGEEALRRNYSYTMYVAKESGDTAEETGVHLAKLALEMKYTGSDCLIHGGEPVVKLAPPELRGKGGRNQQLVLSALNYFLEHHPADKPFPIAFLSGGTDGEDGPTDAAGAYIDAAMFQQVLGEKRNNPQFNLTEYLNRNDAYHFFERFGTLLKTGATGTNVCDVRIVLVQ
ncbi:MAG: DUF4147 domain-containing protein [Planctomycetaceae bacterium]|jgi:glycerate-2-kinase|nr:DUF4147 domain-containing protein [Planctomycetaceae bacterium]